MSRKTPIALVISAILATGCAADGAPGTGSLQLTVSPAGRAISDATYALSVISEAGATVWTMTVTASEVGGEAGRLTVLVPCDAAADPSGDGVALNTVRLVVVDHDDTSMMSEGYRVALAGADSPLEARVACRHGEPTDVELSPEFVVTGGDWWVEPALPSDYFHCSAKLDCSYASEDGGDEPIRILHDASGERARTLVIGLGCTFGNAAVPHLYMDDVEIDCGDAGRTVLTSGAPDGLLLGPAPPLVFEQATYRGRELVYTDGPERLYWNIAIGIAEGGFPADAVCTLRLRAAGSTYPLEGDLLRANDRWGTIRFEAQLNTPPGDALTCGRNNLGDPGGVVAVDEAPFQAPFTWVHP